MALIRNRVDLVLAAAMHDNPSLPQELNYGNCYVHDFGSFSSKKGFCQIKGRFGTGVRGKLHVKYNKLDVGVLLANVRTWVYKTGAVSTLDLVPEINAMFGFDLTAADIVDHPLTNGGSTGLLEIATTSTLYRGSVTLRVGTGPTSLDPVLSVRDLTPALTVWPLQEYLNGCFVSLGHDYTAVSNALLSFTQGQLTNTQAADLATFLSSVDGVPWTALSQSNYSLRGATVLYNGPNSGVPELYAPLLKSLFSHLLVFKVDRSENQNLATTPIAIHYNVFM